MKKAFIALFVISTLTAVSFRTPTDTAVGRWQQTVNGATALLVFRPNDTFDIFINGKAFTSGKYRVQQDTFALADPACGIDYYGTYKLNFFTPDSVRFTAVADSCKARYGAMHRFTAGRLSANAVPLNKA